MLINGNSYNPANVTVLMLGAPVPTVSDLDYTIDQDHENVHGIGQEPVERGTGIKEYSGSVTMKMTDVEQIREIAPGGTLVNLPPFDIVIVYLRIGGVVKHTLKNVQFNKDNPGWSTGDQSVAVKLDFVYAGFQKS